MNPVFHNRTKHIDVRHHFVREIIEPGSIILEHVATEDIPADVLTKALNKMKHEHCTKLLGLSTGRNKNCKVASRGSGGINKRDDTTVHP